MKTTHCPDSGSFVLGQTKGTADPVRDLPDVWPSDLLHEHRPAAPPQQGGLTCP